MGDLWSEPGPRLTTLHREGPGKGIPVRNYRAEVILNPTAREPTSGGSPIRTAPGAAGSPTVESAPPTHGSSKTLATAGDARLAQEDLVHSRVRSPIDSGDATCTRHEHVRSRQCLPPASSAPWCDFTMRAGNGRKDP